MTARNELPPTRYTRTQEMRQAVLDMVHETPGITGSEIVRHFGWPAGTANSRLINMCEMGEMSRRPVEIVVTDMKGHPKTIKTYAYTALVEKTISAETVRRRSEGGDQKPRKSKTTNRKPRNKEVFTDAGKTKAPGYYSQKGGSWAAHGQQGGQGAVRRVVVVGSTLG